MYTKSSNWLSLSSISFNNLTRYKIFKKVHLYYSNKECIFKNYIKQLIFDQNFIKNIITLNNLIKNIKFIIITDLIYYYLL
jgi:hypothetical protein